MKSTSLILLYVLLAAAPLGLSAWVGAEPRDVWRELASGLGMLAFSIILLEFILSGRFKSISRTFGMDVNMRFHQLMGRTALVFALLHPFLYDGSPSGGPRPWDTSRALTLTTDFSAVASGIGAFLLLPSLIALAVGRTHLGYKYETWRLMHGIGAVVIALLLLHHTTAAGRYGVRDELVWFWWTMTGVALASLIYVYLVVPILERRRSWRVKSVTRLTPRQWELSLSPDGHSGMKYEAGQFAWLNVGNSSFSFRENPFSISSAPARGPDVSFIIKELGDFTRNIGKIVPGTRAYIDGPYGNLSVKGRTEPGIGLIAGGVGIAPLIGILRQLRLDDDPREVKVVYGNRTEAQIVCRNELGLDDVTHVLSEPPPKWAGETGWIDEEILGRTFAADEFESWVFVLCGPKAMLDAVEEILVSNGTHASRILTERFDYD